MGAASISAARDPRAAHGGVVAGGADMPLKAAAWRLARYARPQRAPLVLAVLLFFGSGAIDPLLPALFHRMLDSGFGTKGAAGSTSAPATCSHGPPRRRCWRCGATSSPR